MAEQRPDHTGWLLDRYWDDLQIDGRRSSPPSGLDPLLAATLDDLHRRDDALASDRGFADHLWKELMNVPSTYRPNHRFPATHPTNRPNSLGPSVTAEPSSRAHRWPAGVFSTAALIVLTVAVAALASRLPGAPRAQDEPTFGAGGDIGSGPPAGHPLVGSWAVFPTGGPDREDAPVMLTFGGDGTIVATALNRTGPDRLGQGAWEPDGETGARFAYRTTDSTVDPAFGGRNSVAGTSALDATGDAWTGIYRIAEPGSGQGQAAPSPRTTIEAIRITVAPDSFTDPAAEPPSADASVEIAAVDTAWEYNGTRSTTAKPVRIEVAPGQTISLPNAGASPHNFAVEAFGDVVVDMPVGETVAYTVPADAAPGEYEFVCTISGHAAAGMVGLLVLGPPH